MADTLEANTEQHLDRRTAGIVIAQAALAEVPSLEGAGSMRRMIEEAADALRDCQLILEEGALGAPPPAGVLSAMAATVGAIAAALEATILPG